MKNEPVSHNVRFLPVLASAVLQGKKTGTLRVPNPQPYSDDEAYALTRDNAWNDGKFGPISWGINAPVPSEKISKQAAKMKVGDVIVSAEDFRLHRDLDNIPIQSMKDAPIFGRVEVWFEGSDIEVPPHFGKVRKARFMPDVLARSRCVVTSVSARWLQDMDDDAAIREGIFQTPFGYDWDQTKKADGRFPTALNAFAGLWNHIYESRDLGWSKNPLVIDYRFNRL